MLILSQEKETQIKVKDWTKNKQNWPLFGKIVNNEFIKSSIDDYKNK